MTVDQGLAYARVVESACYLFRERSLKELEQFVKEELALTFTWLPQLLWTQFASAIDSRCNPISNSHPRTPARPASSSPRRVQATHRNYEEALTSRTKVLCFLAHNIWISGTR